MAGEIKPGARVWVKDVAALVDGGIVFVETGVDGNGYITHSCYNIDGYAIPDHDALPAVALWLSEYPNGLQAVANWRTGDESGEAADYNAVSAFVALWGPKK